MDVFVNITEGRLSGKECFTQNGIKYFSFEGIPYAKPPVGRLRFRDPQPPEPWQGTLDASKPGNKCPQMDQYGRPIPGGSEDCLYLNIYTPSLPDEKLEKLPVIFFVHGGRFLVGHGDYYRPDYFLQNEVILVTINYRLHILGNLCLHTPEVPGNAALKDTIMALRWVQRNIKYFNGDENNVTAFGESAGAGQVTSYITSNMADGLVHKIIAQSGVCVSDLYLIDEDPVEKAKIVAETLGKKFHDVQSLYEVLLNTPIDDLLFAATAAEISRPPYITNSFFLPVIEKPFENTERFFSEYPLVAFKNNTYKKLPVLVGLCSHEGALFLRRDSEGNLQYLKDIQRFLPRYMQIPYNSPKSIKIASDIKEFYFKHKEIGEQSQEEYINFISDALFNRDIFSFAEFYTKYCDSLYFYHFSYDGNMNTRTLKKLGLKGAAHGDIIQYEFYRKAKASSCNEKDMKMVNFITEGWSNFASNGVPSWDNKDHFWPKYKSKERLCLNIGQSISTGVCPIWPRVQFWLQTLGERSKL